MAYTQKTGGVKEFHYTKEDMERIESEDTDSTRKFKEMYHLWIKNRDLYNKKYGKREKYEFNCC